MTTALIPGASPTPYSTTQPSPMNSSPAGVLPNSNGKNGKIPASLAALLGQQENKVQLKLSDDDKQKIVAWALAQYNNMKGARLVIQRQWYINYAMYKGRQYLEFLPSGRLQTPRASPHRVRQTINLIRPMIRSEIARMTSQKPTATVIPSTTSDEDMFAAQAGEQVWEYLQQRRDYHKKMMRCAFWTSITGTSYMKTWWDPDKEDPFTLDAMTQMPIVGDVCFEVVTPFHLYVPDLLEPEIEDQPYVFEVYTKSVAWVKKYWNITVEPNIVSRSEIIESNYFGIPNNNQSKPDAVLVIEAWAKPGGCEVYPDGGKFTIVGNEVVDASIFYSHKEYPYTKFEHVPTGTYYGDSVLIDINPLQREYNRTRSQITEAKNRMGRPQILAAKGSIDPNRYTNEAGLIVEYKPGFQPPQPMPMQPLPNYVLEEQDRIKSDIEDISAQHQASRGDAPGAGVTAATAISFLQERDDSIMGPTYLSIENGTEKIARQALSLVVDYWNTPRIIMVTGLDQAFDSVELKGSDVINGRNIKMEGGSALPTSRAARQAFLMDCAKMGFISPNDMLDLLDVGGVQKITEQIRVDKRQAQRENQQMKRITDQQFQQFMQQTQQQAMAGAVGTTDPQTGMPTVDPMVPASYPPMIPVNSWDNHAVHIDTHNNYRKSQEFNTLDSFVKDQFDRHVQGHMLALQQQSYPPGGLPGTMPQGPPPQAGGPPGGQQGGPGGPPPQPNQSNQGPIPPQGGQQ